MPASMKNLLCEIDIVRRHPILLALSTSSIPCGSFGTSDLLCFESGFICLKDDIVDARFVDIVYTEVVVIRTSKYLAEMTSMNRYIT